MIYFAVGGLSIGLGIVFMVFCEHISRVGRQTPAVANFIVGIFMVSVGIGAMLVGLQKH